MKDVSKSPLQVHFSGLHSKFSLNQLEPDQLRLLPNLGVRVLAWTLCVFGAMLVIPALIMLLRQPTFDQAVGVVALIVFGVPLSVGGVGLLGRRFRFDRRTGELTIRHFGRTRRRPLTDIVGIQMIGGGTFGSSAVGVISYQLNLVLDDLSEPRLFVAYNCDQADMEKKAKHLADFLQVPLMVEIQVGEPQACDPAESGSVNSTYSIRKDETIHKKMLTACLVFGGAVLGVVAVGTWIVFSPGGQGGEVSRPQLLTLFVTLFCVLASVANIFIVYGKVCWFYRCPSCGKRIERLRRGFGPIQYPCDSCGILWDTGWGSVPAD